MQMQQCYNFSLQLQNCVNLNREKHLCLQVVEGGDFAGLFTPAIDKTVYSPNNEVTPTQDYEEKS